MKRFIAPALAALALLIYQPAGATPVTPDMANKYYTSCMQQSDPRLSAESQKEMCACTSAKMTQELTVEDMKAMQGETQQSRNALNKMLINVYAPCMSAPVKDLLDAECRQNPQVSGASAGAICGCMAKLTGDWYSLSGRTIMAEALKQNPNMTDPTGPVMDSPEFKREAMKNLQSCMQQP